MIYIIDHQDSFTWNVVHQFSQFDKGEFVNLNKFELNKLINNPEFDKNYEFIKYRWSC